MRAGRSGVWAVSGCTVALVLLALGLATGRGAETPAPDDSRVVLVGIRGFSWQAALELMAAGRLPTLAALADGESAKGDLMGAGYDDVDEVLASVVTGRLPFKHEVHGRAGLARLDRDPAPARRTVWAWLDSRGERVAAVGFPFAGVAAGNDAWVVPAAGYGLDVRRLDEPALLRRTVAPVDVPAPLVERIAAAAAPLEAPALGELRRALAADLETVRLAREIARRDPRRHLFLYFEGLDRWRRVVGDASASLGPYCEHLDDLLGELLEVDDPHTAWMLFSERGNPDGPIRYRPQFPRLRRWPPIGFFLAWGDGVKRSVIPHTVAPVDVAATLTYLSGNPVPLGTDGVVQTGMLDDGWFARKRLAFARDE